MVVADTEAASFLNGAVDLLPSLHGRAYLGAGWALSGECLDVSDAGDVVFVLSQDDPASNTVSRTVWLSRAAEPAAPVFACPSSTSRAAPYPRVKIAPDGKHVAFTALDHARTSAVFVMDLTEDGATPTRLPFDGVSTYAWDHDGRGLFLLRPGERGPEPDWRFASDIWTPWLERLAQPPSRLTHVSVADGASRDLDVGGLTVSAVAPSPDGRWLALTAATARENLTQHCSVYVLSLDGGTPSRIQADGRFVRAPRWSPAGDTLVYLEDGRYVVAAQPFDNPAKTPCMGTSQYGVGEGGRTLIGARLGNLELSLVETDLETIAQTTVVDGRVEGVHDVAVSPNGRHVAYARSSPGSPARVFLRSPRSGDASCVHALAASPAGLGVRVERITWASPNGYEAAGLLIRPSQTDMHPLRPVMVCIKGGPDPVVSFAGLGGELQLPIEALAAAGVAVFVPNTAGRFGAGDAHREALRLKGWGVATLNDIASGLDTLESRYGLGADGRAGLMGFSFGGAVTAYCVTQTNRFRAASMADASGPPLHAVEALVAVGSPAFERPMRIYGLDEPYDDPERWRAMVEQSPLHHVAKVATPVLMQNGLESGALASIGSWFRALRHFSVPSEVVLYARSGHGLAEPQLRLESDRRELEWFAFWVLGESVAWIEERYGAPREAWARVTRRRAGGDAVAEPDRADAAASPC